MAREGRVQVNGEVLTDISRRIMPGDEVRVDGKALPSSEPTMVWKVHKPAGRITLIGSQDPNEGRPTLGDLIKNEGEWTQRLNCVGRLDFLTEGLLLLTNDGELQRTLELPSSMIQRIYR